MKLYIVFIALLALSLGEEVSKNEEHEELEAQESNIELLKTGVEKKEALDTSATTYNSNYIPPSQRPPRPWNTQNNVPQNQNYIPNTQNVWNNQGNLPQNTNFNPNNPTSVNIPQNTYRPNPPQNYVPPAPVQNDHQQNVPAPPSNYYPSVPQNDLPQTTYPQNTYPQTTYPQNTYYPPNTVPQNNVPQNTVPQNTVPQNTYYPQKPVSQIPQNNLPQNPQAPQNDWYYPAVITNTQYLGENGNYNYEYQIADGTHVSEQGWLVNPNTDNESAVKKGWYSYTGADGRVYTVTWWADHTGYHAYGDHLPTPPPVPAAIQTALDQAAKEEAEKNKPTYYPTTAAPVYYPTTQAPVYYPAVTQQPTYYPQQPTYYPQQTYPQQQQIKPGHYGNYGK